MLILWMIPLSSFVKPAKSKDFGSPNGTMVWTVSEKATMATLTSSSLITWWKLYHINNVREYKSNCTKILRCESWEVHYFNMFGLIPVWQNFRQNILPNPESGPWIILARSLRGHPSKIEKTLITVLTPISWSYFVTRASTYDLIPCHTSGEHEQTSIMTTTSRSHFGGGSSLQSQVQSWFLISALHSSSGGQYGGSAGSEERWLRWNWDGIRLGVRSSILSPVKCRWPYLRHIQLGKPSQTVHNLAVDLSFQRKDHLLVEVHRNF